MNSTVKTILIAVVFFLLGGAAIFGYLNYSKNQPQNQQSEEQSESVPTEEVMEEETNEPTEEPDDVSEEKGIIEGSLGYPSEFIPALTVYAIDDSDGSKYFYVNTAENQGTFTIEDVDPGIYVVVAYTEGGLSGGYTEAVPCGLSVDCNDHSLIPVTVEAGETVSEVEVKDWYAEEGTFPSKPQ